MSRDKAWNYQQQHVGIVCYVSCLPADSATVVCIVTGLTVRCAAPRLTLNTKTSTKLSLTRGGVYCRWIISHNDCLLSSVHAGCSA